MCISMSSPFEVFIISFLPARVVPGVWVVFNVSVDFTFKWRYSDSLAPSRTGALKHKSYVSQILDLHVHICHKMLPPKSCHSSEIHFCVNFWCYLQMNFGSEQLFNFVPKSFCLLYLRTNTQYCIIPIPISFFLQVFAINDGNANAS